MWWDNIKFEENIKLKDINEIIHNFGFRESKKYPAYFPEKCISIMLRFYYNKESEINGRTGYGLIVLKKNKSDTPVIILTSQFNEPSIIALKQLKTELSEDIERLYQVKSKIKSELENHVKINFEKNDERDETIQESDKIIYFTRFFLDKRIFTIFMSIENKIDKFNNGKKFSEEEFRKLLDDKKNKIDFEDLIKRNIINDSGNGWICRKCKTYQYAHLEDKDENGARYMINHGIQCVTVTCNDNLRFEGIEKVKLYKLHKNVERLLQNDFWFEAVIKYLLYDYSSEIIIGSFTKNGDQEIDCIATMFDGIFIIECKSEKCRCKDDFLQLLLKSTTIEINLRKWIILICKECDASKIQDFLETIEKLNTFISSHKFKIIYEEKNNINYIDSIKRRLEDIVLEISQESFYNAIKTIQ